MLSIALAFKAAWKVLTNRDAAEQVRSVLSAPSPGTAALPAPVEPPKPAPPAAPPKPQPATQNAAITLLAALQREARFVDFLKEPLDGFADAQVGAVAREVHRGCGEVIGRFFDIRPTLDESEGAEVRVEDGYDPGRIRLTGNVSSTGANSGILQHHGWEAGRCELPKWNGQAGSKHVIAPAEIEVK